MSLAWQLQLATGTLQVTCTSDCINLLPLHGLLAAPARFGPAISLHNNQLCEQAKSPADEQAEKLRHCQMATAPLLTI